MDITDSASEIMVAVFLNRVTVVPFVGNAERPVRGDGIFQQGKSPVATFLVVLLLALLVRVAFVDFVLPQTLQFKAQALFLVDFVRHIQETDVGFYGRRTSMTFDSLDVVIQIDVLRCDMPVLTDFLVNFEVNVAEKAVVADGKESGSVAQRTRSVNYHVSVIHHGIADDVVHLTHVEGQLGAIFSTKSGAFRNRIVDLQLRSHLAVGLGREGVHRRQAVGVRIINRWNEIDVKVVLQACVHRLEAHVVDTFHLQNGAEALLRIAQRRKDSTTFPVDIVIDGRRVVDLVGIFRAEGPVAITQIDAGSSSTHVFRDIIEQALIFLFLTDETASDGHPELGVIHRWDALVEVPFGIYAANNATIFFSAHITLKIRSPEETLATVNTLQCHTLGGTQHDSGTTQGIVHTERPLLVGAKHQATTKLVVDVAHGHADEAIIVGSVEIGQSHTVQFTAEAVHLRQKSLETDTRREIAVGVVHLPKTVDAELFARKVGDANALIEHIVLRIGLETAVHLTVLKERLSTRSETDRQGECE